MIHFCCFTLALSDKLYIQERRTAVFIQGGRAGGPDVVGWRRHAGPSAVHSHSLAQGNGAEVTTPKAHGMASVRTRLWKHDGGRDLFYGRDGRSVNWTSLRYPTARCRHSGIPDACDVRKKLQSGFRVRQRIWLASTKIRAKSCATVHIITRD